MISKFRRWLYEPRVYGVNVDDNALLGIHSEILREKKILQSAFSTFYKDMSDICDRYFKVKGLEIELGTGSGFFKSLRPGLITSDVRKASHIDMELDAQSMALNNNSVRCIYAINVFHHLPDPALFFSELERVLQPGGGCILIEPHAGFTSALIHKYIHTDEHFDTQASDWQTRNIGGPLSGANQAMAHIIFQRDINKFNAIYGRKLELIYTGYELNALRYLLSGGVNFRQLVPSFMDYPLSLIEKIARPLARYWSLHQVIVIRKRLC